MLRPEVRSERGDTRGAEAAVTESGYVRKVSEARFDPLKGRTPLLGQIDIELTERCNNACIHCYINRPENDREAQAREMDTTFILDLLSQAAELGCLTVRFTGGEPLLRPDFPVLYLAARKLGMRVFLFTNARLITPELAGLFARVPPGREVEVSVYGMHAGSYDSVAGVRGAYEEFRAGVDLLLDYGIPFIVKSALLPQNRKDVDEFETWAATIPGMSGPPTYSMKFDLRARRDDSAKNRRISTFRITPEEMLTTRDGNASYNSGMREFFGKFMHPPNDRLFGCGAGCAVSVDSYGNAQMCLLLRHPDTVFNLGSYSLRQVITELFPRLREMRGQNREYLERCAACFLKGFCEQCPAKSWMEHGTLDTPVEYSCSLAHAEARFLGLLGEQERAWEVPDGSERIERFVAGR